MKLERKMASYFQKTKKDILMTEKDEKHFEDNNICQFCGKEKIIDKVRDLCPLTGRYRSPAQKNVKLKPHETK